MNYRYIFDELKIHYRKIRKLVKKKGWIFVMRMIIGVLFGFFFYKIFKALRRFKFRNRTYNYMYHPYNVTWMSERTVEIPIIWEFVKQNSGKKILEFGNVLSHYFDVNHDILDKYEKGKGVINEDVIDFQPRNTYDLIVSISTLEHVGCDENLRNLGHDPHKITRAVKVLKNCLSPDGKMILTLPVGQNLYMDSLIKKGSLPFSEISSLKRVSADNVWKQAPWSDVMRSEYDTPYISANGLIIAIVNKKRERKKICMA